MPRSASRSGTRTATKKEVDDMTDQMTAEAPAVETVEEPGANGASEPAAAAPAAKSAKTTGPIQLTVPLDLKKLIEDRAESNGKTAARWALEKIAVDFDYTLPPVTRTASRGSGVKMTDVFAKDLTPEQKRERLAQAHVLLEGLAQGIINLDEIKSKLGV
jgi:hypothetical protein